MSAISEELNWPEIAATIVRTVSACCGCSWNRNLTDAETSAVEAALGIEEPEPLPEDYQANTQRGHMITREQMDAEIAAVSDTP